jgi:hypothetical protein
MSWPDEVLDSRSSEIAEAVLGLLMAGRRWRHRRVETLDPLSSTLVRRRVSLDFTIPPEFHGGLKMPAGSSGSGQYLVPLAWLARRQLVNFDLRDGGGKSIPLLLASQTAQVTRDALLLAAVEGGLGTTGAPTDEAIELIIEASDERPPRDAAALIARAAALGLGDDFVSLFAASTRGFLLLGVLSDVNGRQVVKWQSDEVRPRSGFTLRFRVAGLDEVASTHIALALPDVLQGDEVELWDDWVSTGEAGVGHDSRSLQRAVRQTSPSPERPRLLLGPVRGARRPHVRTVLRVSAADFLLPAAVLSFLAFALLVIGVATGIGEAVSGEHASGTASAAATVLLSAFAALSGLVLRVESHPLVRALLARSRMALGLTALALVVAAAPIGLQLDHFVVDIAWGLAMLISLGAFGTIADTLFSHTDIAR